VQRITKSGEIAHEAGRLAQQANSVRQQRQADDPYSGSAAQQLRTTCPSWNAGPEQMERLDQASQIELGFPHGFLDGNKYIFGNTFNLIDNHRV
jgi:hypothetical protein